MNLVSTFNVGKLTDKLIFRGFKMKRTIILFIVLEGISSSAAAQIPDKGVCEFNINL
jgi:hypothetical protein